MTSALRLLTALAGGANGRTFVLEDPTCVAQEVIGASSDVGMTGGKDSPRLHAAGWAKDKGTEANRRADPNGQHRPASPVQIAVSRRVHPAGPARVSGLTRNPDLWAAVLM